MELVIICFLVVAISVSIYLNDLMNKERGYWASNRTDVERIIQEECDKQIREIIRENFTINLQGKEVKLGD